MVGNPYLGNSVPDLPCKYLLFRKNAYEEVHLLSKAARKRCAALLEMASFIGLVISKWFNIAENLDK